MQCRCPYPGHGPTPIGTSLGNGVVGNWQSLPERPEELHKGPSERVLANCECGCNAYDERPFTGHSGNSLPPIAILPLEMTYEDED